jgi:hypothetical protein
MNTLRCLLLVTLSIPVMCCAQKKIPVEVTHTGDDRMGQLVLNELREAIRTFNGPIGLPEAGGHTVDAYGMRVTTELSRPRIKLQLASPDGETSANGSTPVFVTVLYDSASMPLGGAFIKGILVSCGRDQAAGCARQILAKANTSIEWLREHWPSLWKTL